jgi:hypothetical protein
LTTVAKDAAERASAFDIRTAQVVRTTIRAAMALAEPGDHSAVIDGQIYLFAMYGLVFLTCPIHVHCPTGNIHLYVEVDAKSLQAMDARLSDQAEDLSKLGPVRTLRW